MSARPIIIDCDPGQDDLINILLAFASPDEINLLGITTVAGNVPLALTQRNARLACDLVGQTDVFVSAGCPQPLVRSLATAEYVHGETGIEGFEVAEPRLPISSEHAVDAIVRLVRASEDERLTLVATGPLTNVAMALRKAPDIASKIAEIVIMGGAMFEGGNITPSAEFNIAVDPHAADIVCRSGIPLTLFGLDVTHQFMMTRDRRDRIRRIDTHVCDVVARMLDCTVVFDESKYGPDRAPLHDSCTLLYLLDQNLFDFRECAVSVETDSALTYGHTAVDFWGVTGRAPNVRWAYGIDDEAAFELLCERIARL